MFKFYPNKPTYPIQTILFSYITLIVTYIHKMTRPTQSLFLLYLHFFYISIDLLIAMNEIDIHAFYNTTIHIGIHNEKAR